MRPTRVSLPFLILLLIVISVRLCALTGADSLIRQWDLQKDTAMPAAKLKLLRSIVDELRHSFPDSAMLYNRQALELARASNDSAEEAYFTLKEGGLYYILGEYDFAMECFHKGLTLSRAIGDRKHIAVSLNNLGLVYNMINQEDKAILSHLQSIRICRETGDSLLLSRNLHNLGLAFDSKLSFDTALMYADTTLALLEMMGNSYEQMRVICFKGWVYYRMGKYPEAESQFLRVIRDPTYDNQWEIGYALLGLGSVYQKLGKVDESIRYGLKSLQIAREVNALWDKQQVAGMLAESYRMKGNYKEAYSYYKQFKELNDSLFNEKKSKEINYLQLRHQEDENLRLAQENEINEQRLKRKNFQLIGYTVGLVMLVVLALVLYQKIVQKNRLNRKLAQLNATKDTLFHIMAHDIKSPMSIMISFTELLQEDFDDFSKPEMLKILQRLNKSSREGLQLLENLLDWAKSQTGKLAFTPEETGVKELVTNTLKLMAGNAKAKQIDIRISIPDGLICMADRNMTSVVLRNLISNAIKFTPEEGRIQIDAAREQGFVKILVSDTGVGIPSEDLSKLFNIETTFSTIGTHHEKGSGIGLILCSEFVQKQGGTIGVESEVGKGSRFWFTLPAGSQQGIDQM